MDTCDSEDGTSLMSTCSVLSRTEIIPCIKLLHIGDVQSSIVYIWYSKSQFRENWCVFTPSLKIQRSVLGLKANVKWSQLHFGLTINASVFSETDGGLFLCATPCPRIRNGLNPYSSTGQDDWNPNLAAHLTKEGHYDGTDWKDRRRKVSHILHCRQNVTLAGHLLYHKIKNINLFPFYHKEEIIIVSSHTNAFTICWVKNSVGSNALFSYLTNLLFLVMECVTHFNLQNSVTPQLGVSGG